MEEADDTKPVFHKKVQFWSEPWSR